MREFRPIRRPRAQALGITTSPGICQMDSPAIARIEKAQLEGFSGGTVTTIFQRDTSIAERWSGRNGPLLMAPHSGAPKTQENQATSKPRGSSAKSVPLQTIS